MSATASALGTGLVNSYGNFFSGCQHTMTAPSDVVTIRSLSSFGRGGGLALRAGAVGVDENDLREVEQRRAVEVINVHTVDPIILRLLKMFTEIQLI